ncbi:NAD(P)-dependent dehydrogenase (short-subunit alcohol dehydrogenase family) [Microbacterium trichothecenolyticum]|uniref:SDR family NAD(P)-dependent oxidoreductase n=1 Tax=Microbacterium trichothecenolyticum TaxID=69370 RepID=UPI002857D76C|nr:SDR family oxidoreductase [Microbacterium trichothecenolyticum]MDR7183273.1 NAD(P)-dependent dehydrogenase (short-subunit alcohol dehydrogenase family) [Microbacterium trichothecenolyticum]
MTRLEGKRAVITGAASGMGRATADLFAREGASVALLDAQEAAGREVEAQIRAFGGDARFWGTDVTSEAEVRASVDAAASVFGGLDILVNCAGIIGADKPTHEVSEAEWDAVFAVDVKGVFFATKASIPHFLAAGKGAIVNFSSIYGIIGNDEFTPYHVAKGAVNMQTKQDAATYGRHRIRVNAVNPSTVLTPLVEGIAAEYPGGLPAYEEMMTARQSLRRLGRPVDVARAVLFLASDEADWITGVALPVDGGYTAR